MTNISVKDIDFKGLNGSDFGVVFSELDRANLLVQRFLNDCFEYLAENDFDEVNFRDIKRVSFAVIDLYLKDVQNNIQNVFTSFSGGVPFDMFELKGVVSSLNNRLSEALGELSIENEYCSEIVDFFDDVNLDASYLEVDGDLSFDVTFSVFIGHRMRAKPFQSELDEEAVDFLEEYVFQDGATSFLGNFLVNNVEFD